MKKLLLVLLLILTPSLALAAPGWQRNLTIEWEYEPPADIEPVGFKLYQEGTAVCEWSVPTIRTGTCDVTLLKKITLFTITALFSDGGESIHSDPYLLIDWGPKPKIIKITSRL